MYRLWIAIYTSLMYTPTYSDLYTNAYLLHIYSDIHILRAFRRAADVPKHDPASPA